MSLDPNENDYRAISPGICLTTVKAASVDTNARLIISATWPTAEPLAVGSTMVLMTLEAFERLYDHGRAISEIVTNFRTGQPPPHPQYAGKIRPPGTYPI